MVNTRLGNHGKSPGLGSEYRPVHRAQPRYGSTDDLQLRGPDPGARDAAGDASNRAPIRLQFSLGQHADRPILGTNCGSSPSATSSKWWIPRSRTTSRRCSTGTSKARSTARLPSRSHTSPAASSWSADYVCIADAKEKTLPLEGFVRVSNNSGEEYDNAQIRLVVGTINLVEKIAQLAHIPMQEKLVD